MPNVSPMLKDTESFPESIDVDVRVALVRSLGLQKASEVAEVLAVEKVGTLSALEGLTELETKELRIASGLNIGQMAKVKRACAEARVINGLKGETASGGEASDSTAPRLCGLACTPSGPLRLCSPAAITDCGGCAKCSQCAPKTFDAKQIFSWQYWRRGEGASKDDDLAESMMNNVASDEEVPESTGVTAAKA